MPLSNSELSAKFREALDAIDDALRTTQNLPEIRSVQNALSLAIQALRAQPGPPVGVIGHDR
ncbi:MAG: hypothetical protein ABJA83_11030 [Burkholderiaceae bacterium]